MAYTRCRIDTINSPDDGHIAVRSMGRREISIHEKELCVKLVIYKDYTEMHGQQNIKLFYIISSDLPKACMQAVSEPSRYFRRLSTNTLYRLS